MATQNFYDSFEIISNPEQDCLIRVVNDDSTIREITYEELWEFREVLHFSKNGQKYSTEWLLDSLIDGRRLYGLRYINSALREILKQKQISLWEPDVKGLYLLSIRDEDFEFDDDEASRMEDREAVFGLPVAPYMSFISEESPIFGRQQDKEILWRLGLLGEEENPIGSAKWNDLEGLSRLVKTFADHNECMSTFALLYPERSKYIVAAEQHRAKNIEAWNIPEAVEGPFYRNKIAEVLAVKAGAYSAKQPFSLPTLFTQDISLTKGCKEDYRDYSEYTRIATIGLFVTFFGSTSLDDATETENVWASMKEGVESLGYAFIEVPNDTDRKGVRFAAIPSNLKLYSTMHDHCFAQAERDYKMTDPVR